MKIDTDHDAVRALGRHVLHTTLEGDATDTTDDEVEWSYSGWTIQWVELHDDGSIEVGATQQTTVSELVLHNTDYNRRTNTHQDVLVCAIARIHWTETLPLAGDGEVYIESERIS